MVNSSDVNTIVQIETCNHSLVSLSLLEWAHTTSVNVDALGYAQTTHV